MESFNMNDFIEVILSIRDNKTIFLICGTFISFDIITGYLKAIKKQAINSSISRDGYIKKIGWIIAILLGYFIKKIIGIELFIVLSCLVCVATEGISIYENLGEIGVNLKFKKYFEKLKEKEDEIL